MYICYRNRNRNTSHLYFEGTTQRHGFNWNVLSEKNSESKRASLQSGCKKADLKVGKKLILAQKICISPSFNPIVKDYAFPM